MSTEDKIKQMLKNQQTEGYWYSESEPNYPKPIPNVLSDEEAKLLSDKIEEKENQATPVLYRGFSFSRITGERLGCKEFQTQEWKWPADFRTHYVLEHRVRPTDEFLKYIGFEIEQEVA